MSVTATAPAVPDELTVSQRVEAGVEQVGADVVLGEIRKSCFLIYVTVRSWRGQYQIRNAHVVVDGKAIDKKLTTNGSWKVLPEKWHKALQPFESKCRTAVYRQGVAFKDGVYIVPKSRAKALVDEIKAIRTEYLKKVTEFQAEWPALVEELEKKVTDELGDEQWIAVSKLLPDARNLPKLFDIEIGLWPVSNGGLPVECFEGLERAAAEADAIGRLVRQLRGDEYLEEAELLESFLANVQAAWTKAKGAAGKVIEEHAEEWMGEAQTTTNRMVAAAVESMISEPIKEFAEQIDNLARLSDSGTVRAGTIDLVRRAYQKLQGFSFLLPAELLGKLRAVEVKIGAADPQQMNSGSVAGANLNAQLKAIRDELDSDVGHLNAFGQFARNLDI